MVRRPGLVPQAASIGHAGRRPRRGKRFAHRPHWRRQDLGRVPPQPRRPARDAIRPSAHALYLPPEGTGHGHCPQPHAPGGGHGLAHPHRDPHRRHPRQSPRSAEGHTATAAADHARKPRGSAVFPRRAGVFQKSGLCADGRGSRPCRNQARRPVSAWRVAPAGIVPRFTVRRPVGNRRASPSHRGVRRCFPHDRGCRRYTAIDFDHAARGGIVLGRPHGSGSRRADHGSHRRCRDDHRIRQHPSAGGADVPGAVED